MFCTFSQILSRYLAVLVIFLQGTFAANTFLSYPLTLNNLFTLKSPLKTTTYMKLVDRTQILCCLRHNKNISASDLVFRAMQHCANSELKNILKNRMELTLINLNKRNSVILKCTESSINFGSFLLALLRVSLLITSRGT